MIKLRKPIRIEDQETEVSLRIHKSLLAYDLIGYVTAKYHTIPEKTWIDLIRQCLQSIKQYDEDEYKVLNDFVRFFIKDYRAYFRKVEEPDNVKE